jgi:formate dehydrogenase assembly factor FdhD
MYKISEKKSEKYGIINPNKRNPTCRRCLFLMKRRKKLIRMATQIAETPTLYGKDAEAVLKQIEQTPSKQQIDSLVKKLEQKFQSIETTRRG